METHMYILKKILIYHYNNYYIRIRIHTYNKDNFPNYLIKLYINNYLK